MATNLTVVRNTSNAVRRAERIRDDAIVIAYRAGWTIREIADAGELPYSHVQRLIHAAGIARTRGWRPGNPS